MKSTRCILGLIVVVLFGAARARADSRPNILWITSEDNGPHLGAYGDPYADTPNLDKLAQRGLMYLNAWSNAPVCAPRGRRSSRASTRRPPAPNTCGAWWRCRPS